MAAQSLSLLVILGPTASGKTALSVELAKMYDGEVISADSRAIYKYLDIGTAKPSLIEQKDIVHWGFGVAGPGDSFTAADFKNYADSKIKDIQSRQKLPILVGGTGLYIDAVLYDYSFAPVNRELRKEIANKSIYELQRLIIDLNLGMPINNKNPRHLIGVIERGNNLPTKRPLNKDILLIGICPNKSKLEENIKLRIQTMINSGVIDEIKKCASIYGWDSIPMSGGIYRVFKEYFEGTCSLADTVIRCEKSDRLLAKKQMTWFKRNNDINWFGSSDEAINWLEEQFSGKL